MEPCRMKYGAYLERWKLGWSAMKNRSLASMAAVHGQNSAMYPSQSRIEFGICMHVRSMHGSQSYSFKRVPRKSVTRHPVANRRIDSYNLDQQTFLLSIPEAMKATNVTDVVKVEFGNDVDPEPYLFKHW